MFQSALWSWKKTWAPKRRSQMLNVWSIYLHLGSLGGKCRYIYTIHWASGVASLFKSLISRGWCFVGAKWTLFFYKAWKVFWGNLFSLTFTWTTWTQPWNDIPLYWLVYRDRNIGLWNNPHMGVSKNNGTPKSSILIGFSIINHPFGGPPLFLETSV